MTIRRCTPADAAAIVSVVNDAASAYRGIIAADRWKDPYMPVDELRDEMAAGVVFWGAVADASDPDPLLGVMGLQEVEDVALIRHAYTRTSRQGRGIATRLLDHLRQETTRPMLVGTWRAAFWAVRFYEAHGFSLVTAAQQDVLLRRYWTVPERQIDESVVLADAQWFAES